MVRTPALALLTSRLEDSLCHFQRLILEHGARDGVGFERTALQSQYSIKVSTLQQDGAGIDGAIARRGLGLEAQKRAS